MKQAHVILLKNRTSLVLIFSRFFLAVANSRCYLCVLCSGFFLSILLRAVQKSPAMQPCFPYLAASAAQQLPPLRTGTPRAFPYTRHAAPISGHFYAAMTRVGMLRTFENMASGVFKPGVNEWVHFARARLLVCGRCDAARDAHIMSALARKLPKTMHSFRTACVQFARKCTETVLWGWTFLHRSILYFFAFLDRPRR